MEEVTAGAAEMAVAAAAPRRAKMAAAATTATAAATAVEERVGADIHMGKTCHNLRLLQYHSKIHTMTRNCIHKRDMEKIEVS